MASHHATIDIVRPQDLTASDVERWAELMALRPDLAGPYFDVRYVKAIAAAVPKAAVARFWSNGETVGFLPFQKRAGVLQPLGAPLSDYHGVIAAPGFMPCFDALLAAAGARRIEFQGWVGPMDDRAGVLKLKRRVADTAQGYDYWLATQDEAHHKFFKNIGRCQRNVEKDFGGFAFTWERVTPELLDWTLDLKRDQYKKTGMHDVFACGWTRAVLDDLAALDDEAYGLRAGVFRHDGKIVAAEISLMGPDEVHLWFPAYDPAYYRYSVGILLTVAIIRELAAKGIKRFDFGTGGEDYKSPLTTEGGDCLEGELALSPQWMTHALDAVAKPGLRLSLQRRVRLIRATEISLTGWGRAVGRLIQRAMSRVRQPAPSAREA